MSENKHTPGPWKMGKRKDGSWWISLGDFKTGPHFQGDVTVEVTDADAALIAAAPDLLAALDGLLADDLEPVDGFGPHVEACARRKAAAFAAARAAIAKARGQSQQVEEESAKSAEGKR